jgi:uncharacterized membrane protein
MKALNLGHRVAPARFVIFAIVFLIGLAVAVPTLGWNRGAMVAFDIAAVIFLGLVSVLLRHGGADQMRAAAKENDANRAGLLVISVVTSIVIMVAVITEKIAGATPWTIALVLTSLALAWLFSNIVYALH